jgi:hypothetical protein
MLVAKGKAIWSNFSRPRIGYSARAGATFSEHAIDRNSVARYWDVRLSGERDLGLFPDPNG